MKQRLKITCSSPFEKSKIIKSANAILKKNHLFTLSTIKGNQPYSNTGYYVVDTHFNLYFWTSNDAVHSKNIAQNKRVAVNIYDSHQPWGSLLQGVQAVGIASIVNNTELIKAGFMYIKQFPKVVKFVKSPSDFHSKLFESKLYKIELSKLKILDEKNLGKETWKEITITRSE